MPDKTSPEPTTPASGGPKRLMTIGALCVLIAGGGYVLGGRMSGSSQPAGTAIEAPEDVVPTVEAFVELEPLNVNLADGHYLRVAVAIGVADVGSDEGHGDDDEPPIETAPASDLVLSTFLGRRMPDLATVAGRDGARRDLHEGLVGFYGDDIVSVLFTEFVMQ